MPVHTHTGVSPSGSLAADDVAAILAAQPANTGLSKDFLLDRWVASRAFVLMRIPVSSVGTAGVPSGCSRTVGPIIVDENVQEIGRFHGQYGPAPTVIVIDGKHRLHEAVGRGETTIQAYVGDRVAELLSAANAKHDAWLAERAWALDAYRAAPSGSTLRRLRCVFSEAEVEEVRMETMSR